jgi:hypothetical protein
VPDIDPGLPLTYLDTSQGSVYGQGLLPYAPEIRAAVLAAGAWRQAQLIVAQDEDGDTTFYRSEIATFIPNLTPPDLWAGLAIYQMAVDREDMHNHAAFMYRNPIELDGTTRKASVIVVEALGDHTSTTQSLAWTMGADAHVEPVREPVPYLTATPGPIIANIDAETTAGLAQYVPDGYPGLAPTPGCIGEPVAHYCAQSAAEAYEQRILFFQSALTDPAPALVHPEAGP